MQSDDCMSTLIESITLLITFLTFVATVYAIWYAIKEYNFHCRQSQADTLHKYNERYSSDKNIKKVVEYLILKKRR